MNPEQAWLYKCRLTKELARRNNLVPATDVPATGQMQAHAVMGGPVDVRSLLGQSSRPLKSADFQAGCGSSALMPPSPGTWIRYRQPRLSTSGAGSPRSSTGGGSIPMRWPQSWRLSCKASNHLRSCRHNWTRL